MKSFYLRALVLLLLIIQGQPTQSQYANTNYDVGVFYMPFWYYEGTDPLTGAWRLINNYDSWLVNKGASHLARIPLPNYWPSPVWYDEKMESVTEKQFELMKSNQIDFVVIDSYWNLYNNGNAGSYQGYGGSYQHVLENLKEPGFNFHGMDFAIMWANDFKKIVTAGGCERYLRTTNEGLEAMISYWSQFINHSRYKKINGKPAFYIFYPSLAWTGTYDGDGVNDNIEGIGTYCAGDPFFAPLGADVNDPDKRTKFLLERIEQLVGQELYFVAVMTPDAIPWGEDPLVTDQKRHRWLIQHPENADFDAVTAYGYKYFDHADSYLPLTPITLCSGLTSWHNWNYNYATMQQVHSDFYSYMINNSNLNYQVPVSAGWNQAPLSYEALNKTPPEGAGYAHPCNDYSRDPLDQAVAAPSQFEQSLINAKTVAGANAVKTKNIVMMSAWNEYAEGTVIEPNHQWGGQFLQKVKDVFTPIELPLEMSANSVNFNQPLQPGTGIFDVYPNPIINNYNINFRLSKPGVVKASLYGKEGKLMRKVVQESMAAGSHSMAADINGLSAGIYYFILEAEGKKETKKVVVDPR
jgi:hypothetical protein